MADSGLFLVFFLGCLPPTQSGPRFSPWCNQILIPLWLPTLPSVLLTALLAQDPSCEESRVGRWVPQ